jgi:hypothetical protein
MISISKTGIVKVVAVDLSVLVGGIHLYFDEAAVCSDHISASLGQCLAWEQVVIPSRCTTILHVSGAHMSEAIVSQVLT